MAKIEKLEKSLVETKERGFRILNERIPSVEELMNKINELVDAHNEREEEQSEEWEQEFNNRFLPARNYSMKTGECDYDETKFASELDMPSKIKQFIKDNFIPKKK